MSHHQMDPQQGEAAPVATDGYCVLCNLHNATPADFGRARGDDGTIKNCGNHSQDEVQQKLNEASARWHAEFEAGNASWQTAEQSQGGGTGNTPTAQANPIPTRQSGTKFPYRPADYIVQNLPPRQDSTNDPQLEATNRLLNLSYAWGQIELAVNSLTGAYETLSMFETRELPAQTINKRMKDVRKLAKGMIDLVSAEKPVLGEDMEAQVHEAGVDSVSGEAEEKVAEKGKGDGKGKQRAW